MVKLFCPGCGASLELDDSRDFGFCMYCGTKVMLTQKVKVEHTGSVELSNETNERKQLDAIRILYEARQIFAAREMCDTLIKNAPHCGEAKLLALQLNEFSFQEICEILNGTRFIHTYGKVTPAESIIREKCTPIFQNSPYQLTAAFISDVYYSMPDAVTAKAILSSEGKQGLLDDAKQHYTARLDEEIRAHCLDIRQFQTDPFSLLGDGILDTDADNCVIGETGFFSLNGKLHLMTYSNVFRLTEQNGELTTEFICTTRMQTGCTIYDSIPRYGKLSVAFATEFPTENGTRTELYLKTQQIAGLSGNGFLHFSYSPTRAESVAARYKYIANWRARNGLCPICSSKKGLLFGCKAYCQGKIIG